MESNNSSGSPSKPKDGVVFGWSREGVSIIFWCYIFVKLCVFDFDVYLFRTRFPELHWILDYKFFVLLFVISITWLSLGTKRFWGLIGYILAYPVVFLFWKVLKLCFRNWPIIVAFAPAIHEAILEFRINFAFQVFAILCALFILKISQPTVLIACMILLGCFLVYQLFRSFRRAYHPSVFSGLSDMVAKVRANFEAKNETEAFWKKVDRASTKKEDVSSFERQLISVYVFNSGFDFIADKLHDVSKSRRVDLYLLSSWLMILSVTCLVYAFEYLAMFKISPYSFVGSTPLGFWSFVGFSFDKLSPANISAITPVGSWARLLCYSEAFCALILCFILFFTFLSSLRERYQEYISNFINELRSTAQVAAKYFSQLYDMAIPEVENILLEKNLLLVNGLRKLRGLPALEVQKPKENQIKQ